MTAPTTTAVPPPSRPIAASIGFERPTRAVAIAAAVIAVAFDLAVHHPLGSVASALLVAAAVAGLVASGQVRNRAALAVGIAAVLFGILLALRTSAWVLAVDVAAALALVLLTAGFAGGGSVVSVSATGLVTHAGRVIMALCLAPAHAFGCLAALIPARTDRRRGQVIAVGRGVGLAIPVVVVLAVLLASADAVFASIFSIPVDVGAIAGHVVLGALGLVVASTLFVDAGLPVTEDRQAIVAPFGATETTVVLGSIAILYGLFAAAQVVAITGGAAHVIETAGLTYADYARGGFFQLLGVAAITLIVVCTLQVGTRRETRGQRLVVALLGEAVVALTLVIVVVAVRRLGLYEEAFGSTMLRLASTTVAWWLGALFVLLGLALAGLGGRRRWLLAAMGASALVALVGWTVVNPERVVVERNLAHQEGSGELDTRYLWSLSDDAVPTLGAALPSLDPPTRAAVLRRICLVPAPPGSPASRQPTQEQDRAPIGPDRPLVAGAGAPGGPDPVGGLGANRSANLAAETRAEVCR